MLLRNLPDYEIVKQTDKGNETDLKCTGEVKIIKDAADARKATPNWRNLKH